MDSILKVLSPFQLRPLDPLWSSDTTHPSPVPSHKDIRDFYLSDANSPLVPPPLISHSPFIPKPLIEHLMRRKKNSALGVKFVHQNLAHRPVDEITNMEGALHTFITPIIPRCEVVGDYRYSGGHGITRFGTTNNPNGEKVHIVRDVVLSASIHMDFEDSRVMLAVCKLDHREIQGEALDVEKWEVWPLEGKQNDTIRAEYDHALRRHMVFHLTKEHKLAARSAVQEPMTTEEAISYLESLILSKEAIGDKLISKYVKTFNDQVISLELLYNSAIQQAVNELSVLEAICPQGYVYTYNPASIFAYEIGSQTLNRLMIAALKRVSSTNTLKNLRIFAFNDYADPQALHLVKAALNSQPKVQVLSQSDLYQGPSGIYDIRKLEEAKGAKLVVHNNSDGFGQNIETEGMFGSLDGAIGASSSASGSLRRDRGDLMNFVF
ncbi:hypothetical protein BJ875DRAFT_485221 [Amylocarpus encephaloides]|uniref:Uncharacterized protein n=1 Tax=Amylocarpus encephaloides TaxID=45428 RepID=A0A9P8C4D1_9HELO|nr:hypothetical protein BJ875DRAFT_485221 [Amylocarpus encephaloides]